jgi:peptide deformylase
VGHPALRAKAKKVTRIDRSVLKLLDDMIETMQAAPGIGLAGNQVGELQRLIVVDLDDILYQIINPVILKSEGEQVGEEGCLSIPGYYGDVRRAEKVVLQGIDRAGKDFRTPANGLLAVVFQHEIDHLDGRLFIDKLVRPDSLRRTDAPGEPREGRI